MSTSIKQRLRNLAEDLKNDYTTADAQLDEHLGGPLTYGETSLPCDAVYYGRREAFEEALQRLEQNLKGTSDPAPLHDLTSREEALIHLLRDAFGIEKAGADLLHLYKLLAFEHPDLGPDEVKMMNTLFSMAEAMLGLPTRKPIF